ncbi:MAG: zinc ribbon domain-containing protein [Ruminococcus sp.]|jgi:hypothetical protein|nr:zinc ribbon domain-containing protein [Ruminococcus sp.]
MSDIIDRIAGVAGDVADFATAQSKIVAETAKLKAKIAKEKIAIRELTFKIGEYYLENFCETADPGIAETVKAVCDSEAAIADSEAKLLALKGFVKCQACGANVPADDKFCGKCGAEVIKPAPVTETEPDTDDEPPVIEVVNTEE